MGFLRLQTVPHYITPMKDFFSDPMLLLPLIFIFLIFGLGYVAAMIWAYNRDAQKKGKKSGCMPMLLLLLLISAAAAPTLWAGYWI